jgi:hypothetical protein
MPPTKGRPVFKGHPVTVENAAEVQIVSDMVFSQDGQKVFPRDAQAAAADEIERRLIWHLVLNRYVDLTNG